MTVADPYPANLIEEDLDAAPLAPADPLVRAINRLAQAVEQNTLAILDRAPQPVQNGAQARPAFTPLPPVQTVPQKPPCPFHGVDKVRPSDKFPGFYCTAKDASKPRGYCDWTLKAA